MRALRRMRHYLEAFGKARRNRSDFFGWLLRRPQALIGVMVYETMLMFSNRVDPKLKQLAELKAAALVNCEFCLDIGSALAGAGGLSERQVTQLHAYAESDAYSELEKLVIEFAEKATRTPAVDLSPVRDQLVDRLGRAQVAELAVAIAWENQRARLNQALGVRPTGMSDGAACALPERPAA